MDKQQIEKIKKKQKFNEMLFQITQYNLRKDKAPNKLIKAAKNLGRQLDLPEAELENIEYTKF